MKTKKKKIIYKAVLILVAILFFTGCKREDGLILTGEASLKEESFWEKERVSEEGAEADLFTENSILAESNEVQEQDVLKEDATFEEMIFVHICGAVANPGVYELPKGSRIFHAVESAGGFLKEADENYLNQAQELSDGMQLYIPTKDEVEKAGTEGRSLQPQKEDAQTKENGLININTAGIELLCTLPGIGSAKAADIIAYRETNGSFATIRDIMKVDGIKEGMFSKIKDKICV